jgi:hypothetical protein
MGRGYAEEYITAYICCYLHSIKHGVNRMKNNKYVNTILLAIIQTIIIPPVHAYEIHGDAVRPPGGAANMMKFKNLKVTGTYETSQAEHNLCRGEPNISLFFFAGDLVAWNIFEERFHGPSLFRCSDSTCDEQNRQKIANSLYSWSTSLSHDGTSSNELCLKIDQTEGMYAIPIVVSYTPPGAKCTITAPVTVPITSYSGATHLVPVPITISCSGPYEQTIVIKNDGPNELSPVPGLKVSVELPQEPITVPPNNPTSTTGQIKVTAAPLTAPGTYSPSFVLRLDIA